MTISADMLAMFRRMVAEPTDTTYDDDLLASYIEACPLMDERGVVPYYYNSATTPPSRVATVGWYPTYDVNLAAARIWDEKAADVAQDFDYPASNGTYAQSTKYENFKKQSRRYLARSAGGNIALIAWPSRNRFGADSLVVNGPEVMTDGNSDLSGTE